MRVSPRDVGVRFGAWRGGSVPRAEAALGAGRDADPSQLQTTDQQEPHAGAAPRLFRRNNLLLRRLAESGVLSDAALFLLHGNPAGRRRSDGIPSAAVSVHLYLDHRIRAALARH